MGITMAMVVTDSIPKFAVRQELNTTQGRQNDMTNC